MCCAIVALTMTLLASWRSVSTVAGRQADRRAGWWRRVAIAVFAIGMAAGSAIAADQFAMSADPGSAALCGRLFR